MLSRLIQFFADLFYRHVEQHLTDDEHEDLVSY
jgi:hypothetical protein